MFDWLQGGIRDVSKMFGPGNAAGPAPAPAAPAMGPAPAPQPAVGPVAPAQAPVAPDQAAAPFGHYAEGAAGDAAGATQAQPRGLLDQAYHALTDWHFEDRQAKNGPAPAQEELDKKGSGWELLPEWMSVYHDNHVGEKEKKYINPDGRESVKDGDTGAEVTDPRYMATYNYVSPMSWGNVHGAGDAAEFAARSVGHFAADILPYWLGGNVRGNG